MGELGSERGEFGVEGFAPAEQWIGAFGRHGGEVTGVW